MLIRGGRKETLPGVGGMDKKSAFVGQLETSRSAERDARRGLAVNPGTADAFLSLCLTGIRPKHFHKSLSETRLIGPHSSNIKRAAVCSFSVDDWPTLHSGAERRRFPGIFIRRSRIRWNGTPREGMWPLDGTSASSDDSITR